MPTSGEIHEWQDTTYRTILTAADTGGAMAVIYGEAGPFSGPPAHIHTGEDEVIIVLEGKVEFETAEGRFARGPLEVAFVPRGHAHSFRTGPEGARCITILTPGGFENFFAELARADLHLPRDMAQMTALAARYGSVVVGPGLAQEVARDA
jgi:quercetin dioxygenase-like cupin family protein